MVVNFFVVKKYASLIIAGIIPTLMFAMATVFFNFLYGVLFFATGLIISVLVGKMFLKNPFTAMLEGQGILVINLDSTGVLKPFIVKVNSPYVIGKLDNKIISDVFDRSAVQQLAAPKIAAKEAKTKPDGGIIIDIGEEELNKGRFALFHYPVLLYNQQIKSIITKDMLASNEKEVFAEHLVLYLNRKMEELTSAVRDFGRHVVELTKPGQSLLTSKWLWIIIIGILLVMGIMFLPSIMAGMQTASSTIGGAAGNAAEVITPK